MALDHELACVENVVDLPNQQSDYCYEIKVGGVLVVFDHISIVAEQNNINQLKACASDISWVADIVDRDTHTLDQSLFPFSIRLRTVRYSESRENLVPSIFLALVSCQACHFSLRNNVLVFAWQRDFAANHASLEMLVFQKMERDRLWRGEHSSSRCEISCSTDSLAVLELAINCVCAFTMIYGSAGFHDGHAAPLRRAPTIHCVSTKAESSNLSVSGYTSRHYCYVGLGILLVLLIVLLVHGTVSVRQTAAFRNGSVMPQPSDLAAVVPLSALFLVLRFSTQRVFQALGDVVMDPTIRTNLFRLNQFGHSVFEFIYFSSVAVAGYVIVKYEAWFPAALGGSGEAAQALTVIGEPISPMMKIYYQVLVSYHTHNLIYVSVIRPRDQTTLELALHDLVTLGLLVSSYLANFVGFGANVMILNDFSDLFQYFYFIASDMDHKPFKAAAFLTLLSTWIYLRLVVYPREVLYYTLIVVAREVPNISAAFLFAVNVQLLAVLAMQVYWLWLFAAKYRRVLFY